MPRKLRRQRGRQVRGGGFGDAFFSGLVAPFRAAAKINPVFGFGVDKIADGLGVRTIGSSGI